MADLDKIKARIRALREKTAEAGCTEAEALAAAEAAARILAEYGLTDADIVITIDRARENTSRATWRAHVSASVSNVTNTAAILLPEDEEIEFCGREPGPEIAAYLYQVLCRAVEREVVRFKATPEYRKRRSNKTRRAAVSDFTTGMTARLRVRLLVLFKETRNDAARKEAQQALVTRHQSTTTWSKKEKRPRFDGAVTAGWVAGGDVPLAHGVGGPAGKPLAITKGEGA